MSPVEICYSLNISKLHFAFYDTLAISEDVENYHNVFNDKNQESRNTNVVLYYKIRFYYNCYPCCTRSIAHLNRSINPSRDYGQVWPSYRLTAVLLRKMWPLFWGLFVKMTYYTIRHLCFLILSTYRLIRLTKSPNLNWSSMLEYHGIQSSTYSKNNRSQQEKKIRSSEDVDLSSRLELAKLRFWSDYEVSSRLTR